MGAIKTPDEGRDPLTADQGQRQELKGLLVSDENDLAMVGKVGKGAVVSLVGSVLHLVCTFVSYGLITRYITKEQFGVLSLSLACVNIISVLCCFGIDKGLPGFVARWQQKRGRSEVLRTIFSSLLFCGATSFVIMLLVVYFAPSLTRWFPQTGFVQTLRLMAWSVFAITVSSLIVAYLQVELSAMGKFYKESLAAVLRLILVVLAIYLHATFNQLILVHVAVFLAVFLFLSYYFLKKVRGLLRSRFSFTITRQLVRHSSPLFLSEFLIVVYLWSDTMILGLFFPADEVGVYNAGLRLISLFRLCYFSLGFIYLPVASQLFSQRQLVQLGFLYSALTKWSVVLIVPFFSFCIVLPDYTMGLFFGPDYGDHNGLFFRLLCVTFFLNMVVGFSEMTLIAMNRNKTVLYCLAVMVICNVVFCLFLIPAYGKVGAAMAKLIAMAVSNGLSVFLVCRLTGIHPFTPEYQRILAGLLLFLSCWLLSFGIQGGEPMVWLVALSSVLFMPLFLWVARGITLHDLEILRQIEIKLTRRDVIVSRLALLIGLKMNR